MRKVMASQRTFFIQSLGQNFGTEPASVEMEELKRSSLARTVYWWM